MASQDTELDDLIRNVSAHIGRGWMVVARSLGFTNTEIESIEYANPRNLEEQIYQFFYKWKRKDGLNATRDTLYAALYDGELNELLKKLDKINDVKKCNPLGIVPSPPDQPPAATLDTDVVPDSTTTTGPHTPPTMHPRTPPSTHPHTRNRLDSDISPDSTTNTGQHLLQQCSPSIPQNNLATVPSTTESEQAMMRRKRLERFASNISNNSDSSFGNENSSNRAHRSSSGVEAPPPSLSSAQGNTREENTVPVRSVCPFDLDDMVMVERPDAAPWYGVVRWIGELPDQPGQPIAGIEMDDVVPGGSDGSLNSVSYFSCAEGHGLFLPVRMLKKDNRFDTPSTSPTSPTPPIVEPPIPQNESQNESQNASPSASIPQEFLERMREQFLKSASVLNQAPTPSEHNVSSDDAERVLVFTVPADRIGIIIGQGGRNIQAVERETNTIIKIEGGYSSLSSGNKRGVIRGSDENKKKALELILSRLKKEESQRTAKAERIQIQESKVGLVIGTKGRTINAIRRLSGATIDIKDPVPGLESFSLFAPQTRDCVLTGSEEEVEKAKELIRLAEQGEDIEAGATLAALIVDLSKLNIFVNEEQNNN